MKNRDRLMPAVAIAVMVVLMGLVVATVFDARHRARRALEKNQRAAVTQFAASMEARMVSALGSFRGLVGQGFTLEIGSASDQASLQQVQNLIPEARTGILLVNDQLVVTTGTLLRDPATVGRRYERPGMADALRMRTPTFLPAAQGLTTTLPTIALVYPITGGGGATRGLYVFESEISVDSAFNEEITALAKAGGEYSFIDSGGTVIVSSNADRLAKPMPNPEFAEGPAGFRRAGGLVVATADVPTADWRLVFTQDADAFESGLGGRVAQATALIALASVVFGALLIVVLTRRLRAERAERRRAEEMTAAREEFISIVSHELRTPIAGVLGFLQSAVDHWDHLDDAARRHAAERACANAQRLQALTRDVLDTSVAEAGGLSYAWDLVDLQHAVEAAVTAAHDVRPDRTITFAGGEEAAWVRADPDRIQQVLMNLLDNAAANSPSDAPIEVTVRTMAGEVEVAVADHGPGLADADRERVFEKFVRGRSTVRGTGLGLYLAREILAAHHGRIWVESEGGTGATFRFVLPMVPAPTSHPVS
jgi:signal transduction histidine kinase